MARTTLKQKEEEKKKRYSLAGTREAEELAQARAKQKDMTAVPTPEGFEERTQEEAQAMQTLKQQEAMKKIKAEQPEQEGLKELSAQQVEETKEAQAKIDALRASEADLGIAQRLAQAGLIAPLSLANFAGETMQKIFGGKYAPLTAEEMSKTTPGKLAVPLGYATTFKIPLLDVSISSLFKPSSSKLKELQKDAAKNVQESQNILRMALTRSPNRPASNIDYAIERARQVEEDLWSNYASAYEYIKNSPDDIANGVTLADAMSADYSIVRENRMMLIRYKMSNDPTEIMNALGGVGSLANLEE